MYGAARGLAFATAEGEGGVIRFDMTAVFGSRRHAVAVATATRTAKLGGKQRAKRDVQRCTFA